MLINFDKIFSLNETKYKFTLKRINESLNYSVAIEFLSKEENWVSLLTDEQLTHFMGEWQFQNRNIPEQILKVENELSNSIKQHRSKEIQTHN